MSLIWLPPRSLVLADEVYKQIQHWLIDEEGRILAKVLEPQQNNPEDSADAFLQFGDREQADFISADHAKAWSERKAVEYLQKANAATLEPAAEAAAESVAQEKE